MKSRLFTRCIEHRQLLIIELIFLSILILILYSDAIRSMTSKWSMDDYTHGYLIPFVVVYLLWDKRNIIGQLKSVSSWIGLVPICFGIVLYWLGELGGEFFTLYLSLWFLIVGVVWTYFGWKKLKVIGFPLLLILTAFPFPNFIYNKISLQLKLISSKVGVVIMHIMGMSAYREGNVIDLGFTQLQVVDACSGLRYLFPLVVLGLVLAYFFKARFWKQAILVISTVPIAIITNSLRIALTGILHERFGSEVAEGFFHDFSGWLIFMVSFVALLGLMWILNGFKGLGLQMTDVGARKMEGEEQRIDGGLRFSKRGGWKHSQIWVVSILLACTLIFSQAIEFREEIPISKSFSVFPLQIEQWKGTRVYMEPKIIDALDLSDYVMVNYRSPSGKEVDFYVAYYESQRKGASIHTPATCLRGSGWAFQKAGRTQIPISGVTPDPLPVNRALMEKGNSKQIVYYWFPQRGRILTNAYELKLYAFWDSLTRQRTDGGLVRIITPVYRTESPKEAEKRLKGFTKDVVPVLNQYIPS